MKLSPLLLALVASIALSGCGKANPGRRHRPPPSARPISKPPRRKLKQVSANRNPGLSVERVLTLIKDTLSQGEDLLISGFGKFSVRQKNARRGRNPQTKENLILRARKVVVFKTSGVLRNRINGHRA